MDSDKTEDAAIDALFAAAARHRPEPSDAFLARLSADAEAALPKTSAPLEDRPTVSLLHRLKGVFAASGLSGAAALGVWIGFAMPDLVTTVSPMTDDVAALTAFLPGADLSVLSE